jgi:hypothetical protein
MLFWLVELRRHREQQTIGSMVGLQLPEREWELEFEWWDDELVLCCMYWAEGWMCAAWVCICKSLEASIAVVVGEEDGRDRYARRGWAGSEMESAE